MRKFGILFAIVALLVICVIATIEKQCCQYQGRIIGIPLSSSIDLAALDVIDSSNVKRLVKISGITETINPYAILGRSSAFVSPSLKQSVSFSALRQGNAGDIWALAATESEIALPPDDVGTIILSSREEFLKAVSRLYNMSSEKDLMPAADIAEFVNFPGGVLLSFSSFYHRESMDERHLWDPFKQQDVTNSVSLPLRTARLFSPDGKTFVTTRSSGGISIWDTFSQIEVSIFHNKPDSEYDSKYIDDLEFSPNSHLLATFGGGTVAVWDIYAGKQIATWSSGWYPGTLAFNRSGDRLASQNRLWNIPENKLLLDFGSNWFRSFNIDGTMFVLKASKAGELEFRDASNGATLNTIQVTGNILDVDFSPDGKLLALIREDAYGSPHRFEIWGVPSTASH